MQPTLTLDTRAFKASIERYRQATGKDIEVVLMRGFSGFSRRLIGITPPAQGERGEGGTLTQEDKKRGEASIKSDLAALFWGVKKSREDPAPIHRSIFNRDKVPGKRLRNPQGRGKFYHVDKRKLKELTRSLILRVGYTASGWLSGALAVKATGIPAWVKRHGSGAGSHSLVKNSYATTFTLANHSVPTKLAPELHRRMQVALGYTASALERETQAILKRRGEQLARAA